MGSPRTGMWVGRVLGLDMTLGLVSLSVPLPACFRRCQLTGQGELPGLARVGGLSTPPAGFRAVYCLSAGRMPRISRQSFWGLEPTLTNTTRTTEGTRRSIPRVPRGRTKDNGVRNENSCAGETTLRTSLCRDMLTKVNPCSLRTLSSKPRESSTRAAQSLFLTRFRTCGTFSLARQPAHTMPQSSSYCDGSSKT